MQILGQLIVSNDSSTGSVYYSEWDAVRGGKFTAAVQRLTICAAADIDSLKFQTQTKDWGDADSAATDIGRATTISLTEDTTCFSIGQDLAGTGQALKEAVRFKITLKAAVSPTDTPAWVMVHINELLWNA